MIDYKILLGKHEGEIAFVVGAGTSLYNLDLSCIFDHVVVSVNSGFLLMPWDKGQPDRRYWLSNDALVRRWSFWENIKESVATKLVRNSWEKYYDEIPDFLIFWPRHTSEDIVDPKDDGLCYCSSVPTAIDLCLQMGCKKVFILGLDHYDFSGKHYFWQLLPRSQQPKMFINRISLSEYVPNAKQQRWTFQYDKKSFLALEKFSCYKGAKIYNCNPNSQVEAFEKISFVEAIKIANRF